MALTLLPLLAACHSYKPVTVPEARDETVRIRFDRPTAIRVTGAGDSSRSVTIREVRGHAASVLQDSIRLIVSRGEDTNGRSIAVGEIAAIPLSAAPQLERRRLSASRSYGAVALGVVATVVVYALVNAVMIGN